MNSSDRVAIDLIHTGVPGLDVVLGGGLPEYSINVIAGGPGTGKTTMTQQIVFANASPERRAIIFTALGEPALKMLRYQQQFSFFDLHKVDGAVRFVNLSEGILKNDPGALFETITREVESASPALVVIDSFRTLMRVGVDEGRADAEAQAFVYRLTNALTSWQATTFLVGEYLEAEIAGNPAFAAADTILWTYQAIERNWTIRKLQAVKVRGRAPMPGLHTFRITSDGLQVFPRLPVPMHAPPVTPSAARVNSGVAGLDDLLCGGFLTGDSILVAGPAGTGKTLLAMQFIVDGVRRGEPGILAVFEEQPDRYVDRARRAGFDLTSMVREGKLRILYLRPPDLSVDETLHTIQLLAEEIGARRVVVDSLSGFELAVAPSFREEFRESFYRMIGTLSTVGITVMMTVEVIESFTDLRFSPHAISFLIDDIILQRYVEIDGRLERVMTVVKMRGSAHKHELHLYEIQLGGIFIGKTLTGYRGILTGVPGRLKRRRRALRPGLSEVEDQVMKALDEQREATRAELAVKTSLDRRALLRALDRLLDLGYAIRVREGGRTVYRPAMRALHR